jgi:hypothetical protein
VNFTYSGTAVDGTDFTGVASITIPIGSNAETFTLATIDDALAEGTETFNIAIDSISGGNFEAIAEHATNNSVATTITDQTGTDTPSGVADTAIVSLAGPANVVEGDTTTPYTISVDQLASDVTTPIVVNFTYSGTAVDGTDFTGVASITIPIGSNAETFTLATIDDALAEGTETFNIAIDSISGGNFEAIAEHATNNSVATTITDQTGTDTPSGVSRYSV